MQDDTELYGNCRAQKSGWRTRRQPQNKGKAPLFLHRDPAKGVGHRACQDDGGKDGAQVADHKVEDLLAAEGLAVQLNLLLDLVHADDAGDEQTGRNGRNRHHDRVRQEVEEVEELHPDDRDPRQRAVAQAGQRAQRHHDDADEHRGLFAVPAQLILKR